MSVLRRYGLALFAACVALAVGVALGAGPLQGAASADSAAVPNTSALRDRVQSLEDGQVFAESVARASSGALLASALDNASVTVVVLPGVSRTTVSGFKRSLEEAGALVTVTARVSAKLVDPARKTYTASVAASSINGLTDLSSVPSGEAYAQISALFARAYVGTGNDLALDDEAVKIDSELRGAKLVAVDGQPQRRGSLVVVLAARDHGRGDVVAASHVIEVQLLSALATRAAAVVVATPPSGSSPGGLLEAVRSEPSLQHAAISSLNVTDGAAAQVVAVYALSAAADGTAGAFGVQGTTVTLPPGLAVRAH